MSGLCLAENENGGGGLSAGPEPEGCHQTLAKNSLRLLVEEILVCGNQIGAARADKARISRGSGGCRWQQCSSWETAAGREMGENVFHYGENVGLSCC